MPAPAGDEETGTLLPSTGEPASAEKTTWYGKFFGCFLAHPIIVASLLLVLIWGPVVYAGMLRNILGAILGPVLAFLTITLLVAPPLIRIVREILHPHLSEHATHFISEAHSRSRLMVREEVCGAMASFEKTLASTFKALEENVMKRLEDLPSAVKKAVEEEFRKAADIAKEEKRKAEEEARKLEGEMFHRGSKKK
eukprot:TRINITY_DN75613_c0_g1_i1.p1 TRINITY_DN75613_c0_g1~~TRINITY_DN75613_c0_g1_i1.p1  ORF type:complete len:196 (-),score=38.89 TRINITY_DN75613_c0_g1_i1:289-876(-)